MSDQDKVLVEMSTADAEEFEAFNGHPARGVSHDALERLGTLCGTALAQATGYRVEYKHGDLGWIPSACVEGPFPDAENAGAAIAKEPSGTVRYRIIDPDGNVVREGTAKDFAASESAEYEEVEVELGAFGVPMIRRSPTDPVLHRRYINEAPRIPGFAGYVYDLPDGTTLRASVPIMFWSGAFYHFAEQAPWECPELRPRAVLVRREPPSQELRRPGAGGTA